jgi:hypothetical protein
MRLANPFRLGHAKAPVEEPPTGGEFSFGSLRDKSRQFSSPRSAAIRTRALAALPMAGDRFAEYRV